jgi:hypothetical protein
MTLNTAMRALLESIGPCAFPDEAPAGTATPYAVWQRIGGRTTNYVDDAVPGTGNAFVQVTWWASTRTEADALMERTEAAMITATAFTARPMSARSAAPSDDENLRGAMQDFDIWHAR